MSNERVNWSIQAVGAAQDGTTSFTAIKGVQSVGVSANFDITKYYQIGQAAIYDSKEGIPNVEITMEKFLDGNPLALHILTEGAVANTLIARTKKSCILAMNVYPDTNDSASGTPLCTVEHSGAQITSIGYEFPSDGIFSESISLVSRNRKWIDGASSNFTPNFDNTETAPDGLQQRENLIFDSGLTLLPKQIPGVSSSGTNDIVDGAYRVCVQNISVSADLTREDKSCLGQYTPYLRTVTLPIEVNTEIEIVSLSGDWINVDEAGNNTQDEAIKITCSDTTTIDLGGKNVLTDVSTAGGDAGGEDQTITYSYTTDNYMVVTHDQDPTF